MSVIPRPPTTEEVREALWRRLGPRMSLAGYELHQVHGQRKLFNPTLLKLRPPEGCEVFVGRLPRDLYEDELVPPFLQMGPIYEMRTMMNFSGTNRGFAFVCFFSRAVAARAVETLNNFEIRRGQLIGVLPSVNNRRLYIKGLVDIPNLRSSFEWMCLKTEGIENINLYPAASRKIKPGDPPVYKCAVVTFISHRAAAMARRQLIPLKNSIFGQHVVIDWADPRIETRGPQKPHWSLKGQS